MNKQWHSDLRAQCAMTDILTRHDLETTRLPGATDGEEQLPLEGRLQHPTELGAFTTAGQVFRHYCACVRLTRLRVVRLKHWKYIMRVMYQGLKKFCVSGKPTLPIGTGRPYTFLRKYRSFRWGLYN